MGFSWRKIPSSSTYTISEKAIRFLHPDWAQKLVSSSMSRHLSTCNISSKSMRTFLSDLANRQTDKQTKKHGQKHVPPSLSEVNKRQAYNISLAADMRHINDELTHKTFNVMISSSSVDSKQRNTIFCIKVIDVSINPVLKPTHTYIFYNFTED